MRDRIGRRDPIHDALRILTLGGAGRAGGLTSVLSESVAGAGLMLVDQVLSVGQGPGILVTDDRVSVRLAPVSGLNLDSDLLQLDDGVAGLGLVISNKVLGVNEAWAFTWTGFHVFGAGLEVDEGQYIRFGPDFAMSRKFLNTLGIGSDDAIESSLFATGSEGWRLGPSRVEVNDAEMRGKLRASMFEVGEAHGLGGTMFVAESGVMYEAVETTT